MFGWREGGPGLRPAGTEGEGPVARIARSRWLPGEASGLGLPVLGASFRRLVPLGANGRGRGKIRYLPVWARAHDSLSDVPGAADQSLRVDKPQGRPVVAGIYPR